MGDDEEDIGRDRPCYGEFRCSRCRRFWKSTKSWADCGQICSECDTLVSPANLKKNFAYICYNCNTLWYSFYSTHRRQCRNCKSYEISDPLDPDDSNDQNVINERKNESTAKNINGEHREKLCQKCQATGRPCWESVDNKNRSQFTTDKYKQENTVKAPINYGCKATSNSIVGEYELNREKMESFFKNDQSQSEYLNSKNNKRNESVKQQFGEPSDLPFHHSTFTSSSSNNTKPNICISIVKQSEECNVYVFPGSRSHHDRNERRQRQQRPRPRQQRPRPRQQRPRPRQQRPRPRQQRPRPRQQRPRPRQQRPRQQRQQQQQRRRRRRRQQTHYFKF
ncbi:unnamed protein product [Rotaria socialis]